VSRITRRRTCELVGPLPNCRAAELLLDDLQRAEGERVSLDRDYFWTIGPEQAYDVFNEPSDFTVGQLTECLENLEAIVADPSRVNSYALVWLADLIRGGGHTVIR
jgi:hypothetical protein